jgi:hypothetical protein
LDSELLHSKALAGRLSERIKVGQNQMLMAGWVMGFLRNSISLQGFTKPEFSRSRAGLAAGGRIRVE